MSTQYTNGSAKPATAAATKFTGGGSIRESSFAPRQAERVLTDFYTDHRTLREEARSMRSSGVTLEKMMEITQAYGTIAQYDETAAGTEIGKRNGSLHTDMLLTYGNEEEGWKIQTELLKGYEEVSPKYRELAQTRLDERLIAQFNKVDKIP